MTYRFNTPDCPGARRTLGRLKMARRTWHIIFVERSLPRVFSDPSPTRYRSFGERVGFTEVGLEKASLCEIVGLPVDYDLESIGDSRPGWRIQYQRRSKTWPSIFDWKWSARS